MGTWCHHIVRMIFNHFFPSKKLWFYTWKTNAWRSEDRQFRYTRRSVDFPSKEIKLLKPIKKQNKQKDCEQHIGIFL